MIDKTSATELGSDLVRQGSELCKGALNLGEIAYEDLRTLVLGAPSTQAHKLNDRIESAGSSYVRQVLGDLELMDSSPGIDAKQDANRGHGAGPTELLDGTNAEVRAERSDVITFAGGQFDEPEITRTFDNRFGKITRRSDGIEIFEANGGGHVIRKGNDVIFLLKDGVIVFKHDDKNEVVIPHSTKELRRGTAQGMTEAEDGTFIFRKGLDIFVWNPDGTIEHHRPDGKIIIEDKSNHRRVTLGKGGSVTVEIDGSTVRLPAGTVRAPRPKGSAK